MLVLKIKHKNARFNYNAKTSKKQIYCATDANASMLQ